MIEPLPKELSAQLSAPLPLPPSAPPPSLLPKPGPSPVQDLSAKLLEIATQVKAFNTIPAISKADLDELRSELLMIKETISLPSPDLAAKVDGIAASVTTELAAKLDGIVTQLTTLTAAETLTRDDLEVLYKELDGQLTAIKSSVETAVIKADLDELRIDISSLKPTEPAVTKADLDELRAEILSLKNYQYAMFEWIKAIGETVGLKSKE